MNRRQFLTVASASALAAGAGAVADAPPAENPAGATPRPTTRPFGLDSPPVVQNPLGDSVTINWAVSAPGTGWVEYGPTEDLELRANPEYAGLVDYSERFLSVRIGGLKPGQGFFYRVVSVPVVFRTAYMIELGERVVSRVYRYVAPSPTAQVATFALINDTHEKQPTLAALMEELAREPADLTIHNGDVFDDVNGDDQIIRCIMKPAGATYAAERPLLFVPGNHDHRGVAARGLGRALTPYRSQGGQGDQGNQGVPRCFAMRVGPMALVGLDTGEDKPDAHPVFAGLAAFEPYREAQARWLERTLKRDDIASAPFLVVCCHIPLWGLPGENGGDTMEGFGTYNKFSQQLWHPLIARAGAQLVINGHTHKHRFDPPGEGRPYAQLVGGAPQINFATFIRARAEGRRLEVVATDVKRKELGRWTFEPRMV